jgi:hypothetical protein
MKILTPTEPEKRVEKKTDERKSVQNRIESAAQHFARFCRPGAHSVPETIGFIGSPEDKFCSLFPKRVKMLFVDQLRKNDILVTRPVIV